MNRLSALLPLLAIAGLAAAPRAQQLTAQVTVDPNAGLATYGFQIQGPPFGLAIPAVSLRQGVSLVIPGVLGALDVDPLLLFSLPLMPLPATGFGQSLIPAPLPLANDLPLMFQAVVIDPAHNNQLAFANFAAAAPVFRPANPALPAVALQTAYNHRTCMLRVTFTTGPANANVTIFVNGGQKATGYMTLGADGSGNVEIQIPGCMQRGDQVTVIVNGVPVATHTH